MTDDELEGMKVHAQNRLEYRHSATRSARNVLALVAEVKRLLDLRCPRCGEWVRDFPSPHGGEASDG